MAIGMMNFGWENEVLALLWEDGMGGRSKQRIFNSFKRKKKGNNHRSYSFCGANLNEARIHATGPAMPSTGRERRATKQQNRKLRKTHTAFPKYGKKTGERQKATCRA